MRNVAAFAGFSVQLEETHWFDIERMRRVSSRGAASEPHTACKATSLTSIISWIHSTQFNLLHCLLFAQVSVLCRRRSQTIVGSRCIGIFGEIKAKNKTELLH